MKHCKSCNSMVDITEDVWVGADNNVYCIRCVTLYNFDAKRSADIKKLYYKER